MISYLVARVLYSGQRGDDGLPGEQLLHDGEAGLLQRWVQVHHLVCDTQLVNLGLKSEMSKHISTEVRLIIDRPFTISA